MVEEGVNADDPRVWGPDVTPLAPWFATLYVVCGGGDEVTLGVGQTHVYIWDNDPEALADEAVFAGRFVEAGPTGGSTAILATTRGDVRVGSSGCRSRGTGAVSGPTHRARADCGGATGHWARPRVGSTAASTSDVVVCWLCTTPSSTGWLLSAEAARGDVPL